MAEGSQEYLPIAGELEGKAHKCQGWAYVFLIVAVVGLVVMALVDRETWTVTTYHNSTYRAIDGDVICESKTNPLLNASVPYNGDSEKKFGSKEYFSLLRDIDYVEIHGVNDPNFVSIHDVTTLSNNGTIAEIETRTNSKTLSQTFYLMVLGLLLMTPGLYFAALANRYRRRAERYRLVEAAPQFSMTLASLDVELQREIMKTYLKGEQEASTEEESA